MVQEEGGGGAGKAGASVESAAAVDGKAGEEEWAGEELEGMRVLLEGEATFDFGETVFCATAGGGDASEGAGGAGGGEGGGGEELEEAGRQRRVGARSRHEGDIRVPARYDRLLLLPAGPYPSPPSLSPLRNELMAPGSASSHTLALTRATAAHSGEQLVFPRVLGPQDWPPDGHSPLVLTCTLDPQQLEALLPGHAR